MNILKIEAKIITRWLWYLLATAILFSAVVISLVRFSLTEVDGYREKIELLASQAIHHQVYIESLDAHLVGWTPTLILKGLHITGAKDDKEILGINEVDVGVSLIQSIRQWKLIPSTITLSGTRLALIRDVKGNIALHGFDPVNQDVSNGDNELTKWFFEQSSLAIKNSTIIWKDLKRKTKKISLTHVDMELHNSGDQHQLTGSFSPLLSMGKKVEVALDITGDLITPEQWQGEFFIQGNEIYLTKWGEKINYKNTELKEGIADFQIWGEWKDGHVNKLDGDVSIYQVKVADATQQLDIGLLGGLFEFDVNELGWSLAVERFQYTGTGGILPETNFSVIANHNGNGLKPDIDVRVGKFSLGSISEILNNSSLLTKQQQSLLSGLKPSGLVDTLRFSHVYNPYKKAFEYFSHARLNKVSNQSFNKIPGITNLSGSLWVNQNKGSLNIDSVQGNIDFGTLFRAPIKLTKVSGAVEWWKFQHGWQVEATELQAENNEITTLNNFSVYVPEEGSVYMDLHSVFSGGMQYKSNYLPVSIMSDKLVSWIDRSLISGAVSNAGAVYRGRFSDFPFRKPVGQFSAQLETNNLELEYKKDWPSINDASLNAYFDSKGISINVSLARLFSSAITNSTINIADYNDPVIDVSSEITGGLGDVFRFVEDSPIGSSKKLLDANYSGQTTTNINLHIPLEGTESMGYSGIVHFDKGALELAKGMVNVTDINGDLKFDNKGLNSEQLSALFFGQRSDITVYSQREGQRYKTYLVTSGTVDSALFLKKLSIPLYKHASGQLDWKVLLDFSDNKKRIPTLYLTSSMQDISLNLPKPFYKEKGKEEDFILKTHFKTNGVSDIHVEYGKMVSVAMQVKNKKTTSINKAHIRFGAGDAKLPKNNILYVTGKLDNFSTSSWAKYLSNYNNLDISKNNQLPVYFNMSKLDVLLDSNKNKGVTKIYPNRFPSMSGTIANFTFDNMPLGKLDMDIKPHKGGINVNRLNITSTDMKLTSTGRWNYVRKKHTSNIKARVTSNDLGKLFKRLGLAAIIHEGKADVSGNLEWSATPFDFSLLRLGGDLKVHIEKGSIADIDPGAGRVVGLLSLAELPRRLMLDFSDMFKKGFVFDNIDGVITLNKGNAHTKKIKVSGSAAEVSLRGRIGLVERDYDQMVEIVPKVGDTLPVASGAIFGPQIGAIVYLFEKMLGRNIEKAVKREYKVTGSWDDPVIERTDKPPKKDSTSEEDADE